MDWAEINAVKLRFRAFASIAEDCSIGLSGLKVTIYYNLFDGPF